MFSGYNSYAFITLWCPHWNDHTQGHSCVVAPSDGLIRVAKDVAANVKVILAVTALIHPT